MRHPDPLIMSADIARMAAERPELDGELVQAIYQHLVLIEGRQPGLGELREYVDRVSSLDQDTLRQRLGLAARRRRPARAPAKPSRGRPKGTGLLTAAIVLGGNRVLRTELQGRTPTQEALASRLEVSVRTLQDFLKANGMGWPLAD
jgi:hypothetical protein